MRKMIVTVFGLLVALLIIIGSSGTFVGLNAIREVRMNVVSHSGEYLGAVCEKGYSAVVTVDSNGEVEFNALTLRNHLNDMGTVWVSLYPDYSSLPDNVKVHLETEDGGERGIYPGSGYTFTGHVSLSAAGPGEYTVPISVYARWNGGDALLVTCPVRLVVVGGPTIKKELLSGESEVPAHAPLHWTFRITVSSPGVARNLSVRDVIPGEFDVDSLTLSAGNYSLVQSGGSHHILWRVDLAPGESGYMDVTVHTKLNPAGNQEFTECGSDYLLNEGAEIRGYGVKSGNISVHTVCPGSGDCDLHLESAVDGRMLLLSGQSGDYHTRISFRNEGNERDFVVKQEVGAYFSLVDNVSSRGTLSILRDAGGSIVTWRLHLGEGESATLDLYEHTEGITDSRVLLVDRVCINGCGCFGGAHYVSVVACHKCGGNGSTGSTFQSEDCEGDCER